MSSSWERLGEEVTAARIRRGHVTLASFATVSGLSTSTLDSIEHARKTSYGPATLAALEHALGWKTGSVDRVLRGLKPQQESDPDLVALMDAWPRLSPGSRRMLRVLAIEAARAEQ
jgi:transcriptional regulator with XRE-family HTH domain